MTFAEAPQRGCLLLASALLASVLLGGCGPQQVVVEGDFPPPLMTPLPLTLGVWYDQDFSEHEFFDEAAGRGESSWIVTTGEAQVEMWDTLLGGMFRKLVHLKSEPGPGQRNPAVDAVLIPHVDELQYAIPAHTSVKVYEIWMRYRFELVTVSGEPIADWTMTSYGKTPTAFLQSDQAAVNLAAVMALRDAGAHFATGFTAVPAVREWLEKRNIVPLAQGAP
tara:strand:- start:11422 stop:12087 length:666 start_codon:yes stop_codon:yes gene_type:complete